MAPLNTIGLLALALAATAFAAPQDCTHTTAVPLAAEAASVKTVYTTEVLHTKHVDCGGCRDVKVFTVDHANRDCGHMNFKSAVVGEGVGTRTVYACRQTQEAQAVQEPMELFRRQATTTAAASPPAAVVTVTGIVTEIPPVKVVVSTILQTAYTKTTTSTSILNCTQSVYATPSIIYGKPSKPAKRQATTTPVMVAPPQSVTTSVTTLATTPAAVPPAPAVTSTINNIRTITAVARTSTSYTIVTQIMSTPLYRTAYECSNTLAYQYLVDATSTITYSQTLYSTTVNAVTTLLCPGVGGFPAGARPIAPTGEAELDRRQDTTTTLAKPTPASSSTTAVAAAPTAAAPTTAAPATPVVPITSTTTLHLTRTAYTVVTITAANPMTNLRSVCSTLPYDVTVTVPVYRTAYPSAVTVTYCPRRPTPVLSTTVSPAAPPTTTAVAPASPPPATSAANPTTTAVAKPTTPASMNMPMAAADDDSAAEVERRQATSTTTTAAAATTPAASQVYHRTTYVAATVTVTAARASTVVVYTCAADTTATPARPVAEAEEA